jgi:hypothetical protein
MSDDDDSDNANANERDLTKFEFASLDAYGTRATYTEGVGVIQSVGVDASVLSASEGKTTSKSKGCAHPNAKKQGGRMLKRELESDSF